MTVHAVLFRAAPTRQSNPPSMPGQSGRDLTEVIPVRIQQKIRGNHREVLASQRTETQIIDTPNIPQHLIGTNRFDKASEKSKLVDDFVQNVLKDAQWHRIEYHVCDHDLPGTARTGCPGWTIEVESGPVPENL